MQDAFISYSRRDRVFVRRLLCALKKKELEVWVDIEGLYGGEEYWPEIRKAIEASNAVLWIISPDSVSSGVSQWGSFIHPSEAPDLGSLRSGSGCTGDFGATRAVP